LDSLHQSFITSKETIERDERTTMMYEDHHVLVTFPNKDEPQRCRLLNLTLGGAGLVLEYSKKLKVDCMQQLSFTWPDDDVFQGFPTEAIIRWYKLTDTDEMNLGVQFITKEA